MLMLGVKKGKRKRKERQKGKRAAGNSRSNTTKYFDKRIGLEDDDGMPTALAERVY
jgi:hypothetical protein